MPEDTLKGETLMQGQVCHTHHRRRRCCCPPWARCKVSVLKTGPWTSVNAPSCLSELFPAAKPTTGAVLSKTSLVPRTETAQLASDALLHIATL